MSCKTCGGEEDIVQIRRVYKDNNDFIDEEYCKRCKDATIQAPATNS